MKKVSKGTLKAKMFEYFRDLEEHGGSLVVTDYGKPVLQILPYTEKKSLSELFEGLRGKAKLPRKAVLDTTEDEWSDR